MSSIWTFTSRRPGAPDAVRDRLRFDGPAVADVERETERRVVAELAGQPLVARNLVDQHAGLRFEPETHARVIRRDDELGTALDEAAPGDGRRHVGTADAAPERDRLGAEVGADPDRPPEELQAALAAFAGQERRLVLSPWIEDVASAGLDDDGEPQLFEPPPDRRDPSGDAACERVEVADVERQCDALVAEPGDDRESIVEPMAPKPVRAVAKSERRAHVGDILRDRRRARTNAAATGSATPNAPARDRRAACSGMLPWIPATTARRTTLGPGESSASSCRPPNVDA